jgi:alpha-L-rhamnosidase
MTSYTAVVPANSTATLYLPVISVSGSHKSDRGATFVRVTKRNNLDVAEYELSSGSYKFIITSDGVRAGELKNKQGNN